MRLYIHRLEKILLTLLGVFLLVTASYAGWYKHVIVRGYQGTRTVYCADIDDDGDMDVLGAIRYDNLIGWWENLGQGEWTEHVISSDFEGAWDVHAADMDDDGSLDILGAAMTAGRVGWWRNTGGPWEEHILSLPIPYTKGVFGADLNDDGAMDILSCSYSQDKLSWAENLGDDNWEEHILTEDFDGVRAVHADDVDQDGDIDILAAAGFTGVWWWESHEGEWIQHMMPDSLYGARSVYTADFVGDSYREILTCSKFTDKILYWQWSEDEQEWIGTIVAENHIFASDIYAGDVDGDGDEDIVGGWHDDDMLIWYENVDRTGSWIEHTVSVKADGIKGVFISDIDDDGDNDILAACTQLEQIAWWENEPETAITLDLEPLHDPYLLPHTGGDIEYTMHFNSILNAPLPVVIIEVLRYPNGELHETEEPDTVQVEIGESDAAGDLFIDEDLPSGDYKLLLHIHDPENNALLLDSLQFTKEVDTGVSEIDPRTSRGINLSNVYPNPFNATTGFSIHLPAATEVRWLVTDILGRRVLNSPATPLSQGNHRININLDGHASGIYLLHVLVSGQPSQSRKIVLMN